MIVTVFDENSLSESMRIAAEIRQAGYRVVAYPEADKLGKQFKFADKLDIPVALILGPDELANGQVAIKNLKTRAQITVAQGDIIKQLRLML